jgi:hypothetical protein
MTIRRGAPPKQNFTILPNATINDSRFSYRALGLLTFLLSKPENWTVDASALSMGESREGRDAIRKALNEIEEAGYLVREKRRDLRGRWITEAVIYDTPMEANSQVAPATENPSWTKDQVAPATENPTSENQGRVTSDGKPGPYKRKEKRTELLRKSKFDNPLPGRIPENTHDCDLCAGGWIEDPLDNTIPVTRCPNAETATLKAAR